MIETRSSSHERTERDASSDGPSDYEALIARINQLERQQRELQPQQPAPQLGTKKKSRKLTFGQPFSFDGSREDQKVITWISRVDTQIRMNAKALGEPLDDEEKLLIAESHLDEAPLRQYNVKVRQDGSFANYEAFAKWIREFYAPSDLLALYRQQYRRCRQRSEETVEQYYLRFTELVNKLDTPPEESWQVSDFVDGLQAEYAERLDRYDDISDYKTVTIKEIMTRLNRTARLAGKKGPQNRGSQGNTRGNPKPLEQRISSHSKPRFKSDKKKAPNEPLTAEQRRRLERLIQKGGGEFVGKDVRDHSEWWKMAREQDVCGSCAGKGHAARYCPLDKPKTNGNGKSDENGKSGTGGHLNAMVSGYSAARGN
jgi:hypothetical protein